jgi:hypothetical protein
LCVATLTGRKVFFSHKLACIKYLTPQQSILFNYSLRGYCSLGRPLPEVSRPLVVTNIYIILAWAATATASGILKWLPVLALEFS